MIQCNLDLTTDLQRHYKAAAEVARSINHTRSRRTRSQRVHLWAAHIKAVLGLPC